MTDRQTDKHEYNRHGESYRNKLSNNALGNKTKIIDYRWCKEKGQKIKEENV